MVWYFQYLGGSLPQWGGRYILTSGLLLLVLGVVSLSAKRAQGVLVALAAGSLAVGAVGVAWTVERTHDMADAMAELANRPEEVVVFDDPLLARGGGALLVDAHWLSANGEEARASVVELLGGLGVEQVAFVDHADGSEIRDLPTWTMVGEDRVDFISGLELRVTTWQAPG